jgi:hypothetical protein
MTAKNEHTGDAISTRPYSDKYGEGHDRIWGNKCSRCGCRGIHACIGHEPKPWTDEEKQRLAEALEKMRRDLSDIADA